MAFNSWIEATNMNKAAQALGRKAKGVPKSFSKAEIEIRKKRLAEARAKRWAGHKKKRPNA